MINVPFVLNLAGFWLVYNVVIWALKHNLVGQRVLSRCSLLGCQFGLLQIRWFTPRFNRPLVRLVTKFRLIVWRRWFALGTFFTVIITLVSVILLCLLLFNTLAAKLFPEVSDVATTASTGQNSRHKTLVPLIPGVNLPNNQIVYVLVALFACAVFHELGHAIAALADQVRLNGCGVFIFLVYPGAYVDLSTESLKDLPPLHQLRIYCAGVWHNFVMCLGAIVLLLCLPMFVWSLVFNIDTGVVVTAVVHGSPLSGPRGLVVGEELTAVANCSVTNSTSWRNCISKTLSEPQLGNCMLPSAAQNNNQDSLDCCKNSSASRTNACFYHAAEDPSDFLSETENENPDAIYSCLPAHSVINDRLFCLRNADCVNRPSKLLSLMNVEAEAKKEKPVCVFPKVDKMTRLLPVLRRNRVPLLFYGYPSDLLYFTTVSDYIPVTSVMPATVPIVVDTILRYVLSLSAALVLLNAVPCYGLDGQHILSALVEQFFPEKKFSKSSPRFLYNSVLAFGTFLLIANVAMAFLNLF